jgi:hypothetical protein
MFIEAKMFSTKVVERSEVRFTLIIPFLRKSYDVYRNKNNSRSNWNRLKITQKIPEQHTRKARNQGCTENSHGWHGTHASESTDIKVQ